MSDRQNGEVLSNGKTFFTSKGIGLELIGISPLLIAKLQNAGELPPVPVRKVPLDFETDEDGEPTFQTEELSEDDLQNEEEEKLWKDYIAKRDAVLSKRNDGFLKAIFAKGVNVDLTRLDNWKSDMEFLELTVPDHPLALKVEYVQTEAIGNTEDMVEIITGVLGESGIPEEDLADIRASFRDSIRRSTPGETVDSEVQVDVESDVHGDESRPLLEGVASQRLLQGE